MRRLIVAAVLALGLAGCGASSGDSSPSPAEFIQMRGPGNFAMIVPNDVPADRLPGLAKDKCGEEAICWVYAWHTRDVAARALPLTEPEATALAFEYKINRSSGFEQAMWNCADYPAKKASGACMAPFEPES